MPEFKDLTNQRFGRLVAIYPTKKRKNRKTVWVCQCDCGNLTEVVSTYLIVGDTKSCGCLRKEEVNFGLNFIHGDSRRRNQTRLYNIWQDMKRRCLSPSATNYSWYGGRGIAIYNKWIKSYWTFKAWAMSHGYADNLVIDRIDNDGNYEPNNCQFITQSENSKKSHRERRKK